MSSLPTGTITFMFTDIESSTPFWEREPEKMAAALQVHNQIMRQAIEANGGFIFKFVGDEFQAAFATTSQALKAAIEGQRALKAAPWNELGALKVRMGVHTGEATLDPQGDEYAVSHTKNRIGRVRSAAYGGQILLSQESADLVSRRLPEGVTLKDLGEHRLKGMEWLEHLYQVCTPDLPKDFPPLKTQTLPKNNLPRRLTRFIGREKEIAQIKELLEQCSLVTLTGAGGVGKTRLALQVAHEVKDRFPDGVWLVELATVTEPALLPQAVAMCLGLHQDQGFSIIELLVTYLNSRQILLILDNCEHLIEACAKLAGILLPGCAQLEILATSREPLGVAGETSFYVPSLTVPNLAESHIQEQIQFSEAARLFEDRARAVVPTFHINESNALTVARVCIRLEGIPLAIELAAARVNLLSVEQLADRLELSFKLLTGGPRTSMPRHQTLRAAIDWSYNLLSQEERSLLQRLSIFSGGWELEAAEKVCSSEGIESEQVLDLLASLVSKSMVLAQPIPGGEMRYRLLETVHQFAREKLFDSGDGLVVYNRHRDYYLWLAEQAETRLRSAARLIWLRKLTYEQDNLRQALEWSFDQPDGLQPALRMLAAIIDRFWWPRGYVGQVQTWLEKGLALARDNPSVPPLLLAAILSLRFWTSNQEKRELAEECITICRKLGPEADLVHCEMLAKRCFASAMGWGDFAEAAQRGEECLELVRRLDPAQAWYKAHGLILVSWAYTMFSQEYDAMQRYTEESQQFFQLSGDRWDSPPLVFGLIAVKKGNFDQALAYFEEAISTYEEIDDKIGQMFVYFYKWELELLREDYPAAKRNNQKLMTLANDMTNIGLILLTLRMIGIVEVLEGKTMLTPQRKKMYQRACQCFGAADHLAVRYDITISRISMAYYQPVLATLHSEMASEDFDADWKKGLSMSLDEVAKFGLLEEV